MGLYRRKKGCPQRGGILFLPRQERKNSADEEGTSFAPFLSGLEESTAVRAGFKQETPFIRCHGREVWALDAETFAVEDEVPLIQSVSYKLLNCILA